MLNVNRLHITIIYFNILHLRVVSVYQLHRLTLKYTILQDKNASQIHYLQDHNYFNWLYSRYSYNVYYMEARRNQNAISLGLSVKLLNFIFMFNFK